MQITVRFACTSDAEWCGEQEPELSASEILESVSARRIAIALANGDNVGYLRVTYIWPGLPFIALISVMHEFRGRGIGDALLSFVLAGLKAQGITRVLTSAQANEPEPLTWWEKSGFSRCGMLHGINRDGIDEVFFLKTI